MISILLAPDRSEIVAPILDAGFYDYEKFVGVDTGKRYDAAYLRIDQDPDITEQKLARLSDIGELAMLFAPSEVGRADVIASLVRAMLGCATQLADLGYGEGDVVTIDDANTTRKET